MLGFDRKVSVEQISSLGSIRIVPLDTRQRICLASLDLIADHLGGPG